MDATGLKIARQALGSARPFGLDQASANFEFSSERSREEERGLTDRQITEAVRQGLRRDPRVPAGQIQVETEEGAVRLAGRVSTLLQRDRAIGLANAVRGVTGVENWIEIDAPYRPDRELQRELLQTWRENPALERYEIQADIRNGSVRLRGVVQSWQEWQAAENAARGVFGVRQVENELAVRRVSTRADTQIAADIRNRLRHDARLADNDVRVDVRNGRVTLSGIVGSELENDMAIAGAKVMNVHSVDADALRVVPRPGSPPMARRDRAAFGFGNPPGCPSLGPQSSLAFAFRDQCPGAGRRGDFVRNSG